jgi:hypothetical protein
VTPTTPATPKFATPAPVGAMPPGTGAVYTVVEDKLRDAIATCPAGDTELLAALEVNSVSVFHYCATLFGCSAPQ